jgi:radical SAM superfamily enzyme YgiQ (UPF0313 family)
MSLGLASIKALLDQRGIANTTVSWSVTNSDFDPSKLARYVLDNQDGFTDLAFGAFVWNETALQLILRQLRKEGLTQPIILGGPQVSYVKRGLEKLYPEADVFVRGYAEEAVAQLMMRKEPMAPISGVHYAGQPDLGISASAPLEQLPSPFLSGIIQPQRFIRWETQRGCPFRCAFCQHRESDLKPVRRSTAASRIDAEIDWITSHRIIQDIAVLDPVFNSGGTHLGVLDRLADRGYSGKLALQCRLEMATEPFLDRVARLNRTARVVLECGLQTVNREEERLIDRGNNLSAVARSLAAAARRGVECEVSLIYGLPGQTLDSFRESVAFCRRNGVRRLRAFPLMLLRGTPLHARRAELGLVEGFAEDDEAGGGGGDRLVDGIPLVVSSPTFSRSDWREMARIARDLDLTNDSDLPPVPRLPPVARIPPSQATAAIRVREADGGRLVTATADDD